MFAAGDTRPIDGIAGAGPTGGILSVPGIAIAAITSPVQFKGGLAPAVGHGAVHRIAESGVSGVGVALPFLERIQAAFGRHELSGVVAHVDEHAARSSAGLRARAFTIGDHVAFGGPPDLHTAAHEAAHVVQQRAGVQLAGDVGRAGDPHEQHADAVADRVAAGESAEPLLDEYVEQAPAPRKRVQRKPEPAPPAGEEPPPANGSWEFRGDLLVADRGWLLTQFPELAEEGKKPHVQVPAFTRWILSRYRDKGVLGWLSNAAIVEASNHPDLSFQGPLPTTGGVPCPLRHSLLRHLPLPPNTTVHWLQVGESMYLAIDVPAFKAGSAEVGAELVANEELRARIWKALEAKVHMRIRAEVRDGLLADDKLLRVGLSWDGKNATWALSRAEGRALFGEREWDMFLGTGKGGSVPGWAQGKVDAAKKLLHGEPSGGGGDRRPAPPPTRPDRVVEYSNEHGVFVNVWVDRAHGTVAVTEQQTPEQLKQAILDKAVETRRSRDAAGSVGVVDGAEQTGFIPPKGASGGKSTVESELGKEAGKRVVTQPAYPSAIKNYGAEITTVGATNSFTMELDYHAMTQGTGGMALLDETTNRMQRINYYWELLDVTDVVPEEKEAVATRPVGSGRQATPAGGEGAALSQKIGAIGEDTAADLKDLTSGSALGLAATWQARAAWLGVVGLSNVVRLGGALIGSYVSVLTKPLNEQKIGFDRAGDFLVRCVATPVGGARASSVAVAPIRVMTVHDRATLANDATARALVELKARLAKATEGPAREELKRRLASLQAAERQNAAESTADALAAVRAKLTVLGELDAAEQQKLPREQRTPEVRLLAAQLELLGLSRAEYRRSLKSQETGLAAAKTRVGQFAKLFPGTHYRPAVTLASEENGQVVQMLMMLGEVSKPTEDKRHYVLVDVTSPATQQKYEGRSDKPGLAGHEEAIRAAFVSFRENADYGRGTIAIRMPEALTEALGGPVRIEPTMRAAPGQRARVKQRLTDLAAAAAIAGMVVSGPIGLAIGAAGGIAGAVVAIDNMMRRASGLRLHWDFETIMDIVAVVGGAAGVAGAAVGHVANLPKWASGARRVQGVLHIFAYGQLGVSAIAIPIALEKQLAAIDKDPNLSPGERAARITEAFLHAVKDGTITVASAAQLLRAAEPLAPERARDVEGAIKKPAVARELGAAEAGPTPRETPSATTETPAPRPRTVQNERTAELARSLGELVSEVPLVENPALEGWSVRARFVDGVLQVEVGPAATPRHVKAHLETVRLLRRFQGPVGAIRRLISRIGTLLRLTPGFREGFELTEGAEARLEVRKLGAIKAELERLIADIDARVERLGNDPKAATDSAERVALAKELATIEHQLAENQRLVDSYRPGKGFIAAYDKLTTNRFPGLATELQQIDAFLQKSGDLPFERLIDRAAQLERQGRVADLALWIRECAAVAAAADRPQFNARMAELARALQQAESAPAQRVRLPSGAVTAFVLEPTGASPRAPGPNELAMRAKFTDPQDQVAFDVWAAERYENARAKGKGVADFDAILARTPEAVVAQEVGVARRYADERGAVTSHAHARADPRDPHVKTTVPPGGPHGDIWVHYETRFSGDEVAQGQRLRARTGEEIHIYGDNVLRNDFPGVDGTIGDPKRLMQLKRITVDDPASGARLKAQEALPAAQTAGVSKVEVYLEALGHTRADIKAEWNNPTVGRTHKADGSPKTPTPSQPVFAGDTIAFVDIRCKDGGIKVTFAGGAYTFTDIP